MGLARRFRARGVKRIAAVVAVVGLGVPLFGGVASALPNFALAASPQVVDFGRVRPILGTVSASVTITNVSADNLTGGVYGFRGDVNLPKSTYGGLASNAKFGFGPPGMPRAMFATARTLSVFPPMVTLSRAS